MRVVDGLKEIEPFYELAFFRSELKLESAAVAVEDAGVEFETLPAPRRDPGRVPPPDSPP